MMNPWPTSEVGGPGLIVVSGIPGSGKTTLANALASHLALPLIAKDTIKEALFDALGSGDLVWSRQLGGASHGVMYALVAAMPTVIVESFFWPGRAEAALIAFERPMVQIHCDCPTDVAVQRYRARESSSARHSGHRAGHQDDAAIAAWANNPDPQPLDLPGTLIHVRTTDPVDIEQLASRVTAALTTE